jgi:very-short-patch-repair endonuclease
MKGRVPWNKGLRACDNPKAAEAHKRSVETRKSNGGYEQPEERRQRTSATMKAEPEKYRENRKKQDPPRQKGTDIEQIMWSALEAVGVPIEKNPKLIGASGISYDRDILVGGWLNVECDSPWHTEELSPGQPVRDARSDADLTKNGYEVMRVQKENIKRNARAIAIEIRNRWLSRREPSAHYIPGDKQ